MKNKKQLLFDLRDEYLELINKLARATFAIESLSFSKQEGDLLKEQVAHMKKYAEVLLRRANYIKCFVKDEEAS